jgi:UDP-N-acetylglucosamine--N-acetylmuramyl-(pentapeptide) pyrophosphoryl-undecaprenol N-acetylglucosamine transferase
MDYPRRSAVANLRVIIAGGGTGGHVFPALAIAEEIMRRQSDSEIIFVGTKRGIESNIVPQRGYKLELIEIEPLYRREIFKNISFPFKVLNSILQCRSLMKRYNPRLVIGTGGYVSGPVLYAASLLHIPRAIQEQNAFPGWTTRMLAPRVDQVFLGFVEARKHLRGNAEIRSHGNPVPPKDNDPSRREVINRWGLNPHLPTVLITGGSQGALSINQAVREVISEILDSANLVWQTGKRTDISQIGIPDNLAGKAQLRHFFDPMNEAYAVADLAVSRAGALTLAELTLRGIPSILIPYPHAAAGHQEWNAKALVDAEGAIMISDHELYGLRLAKTIKEILSNPEKLASMRQGMLSMARPDALKNIVDDLETLIS